MLPFLQPDELEGLRRRQFSINAGAMRLIQNKTKTPLVITGPGNVKQDGEKFTFAIYTRDQTPMVFAPERMSMAPGEVYPDHLFYTLEFLDNSGRKWVGERSLPDQESIGDGIFMVTGSMRGLSLSHAEAQPLASFPIHSLKLTFFDSFEFPCNNMTDSVVTVDGQETRRHSVRNVALFKAMGLEFKMTRGDSDLVEIDVQGSTEPYPAFFETRIVEALQFVLARHTPCNILEKEDGEADVIRIRGVRSTDQQYSYQPPLAFNGTIGSDDTYRMLAAFLPFICSHRESTWHPASEAIYTIIEAKDASLEIRALALSVAAESLANCLYPDAGQVTNEERDQIAKAMPISEALPISLRMKKRVRGTLGSMLCPSASDRFHKLTEDAIVTKDVVSAWKRLRNSAAHGERPEWETQELVDLCDSVTTLCHMLIFGAIGYKGHFTDYSTRGWPKKEYPLPKS